MAGELADSLASKPKSERLVFAKDECEALVDAPVTAGFQIPAIVIQNFEHIAILLDRDLVLFFLGLFGNDCCHDVYSFLMSSF
jgi:hypothetical protein